uniref:Uncharacterized protein n=1 Tax=Tanacetum cinerariifolium TaxID=118510 RepID=A0A699T929_TANCI|nr:hypothetical protein [Tanacetum cinerariifolium]
MGKATGGWDEAEASGCSEAVEVLIARRNVQSVPKIVAFSAGVRSQSPASKLATRTNSLRRLAGSVRLVAWSRCRSKYAARGSPSLGLPTEPILSA